MSGGDHEPVLSVVIPTRNGLPLLARQLDALAGAVPPPVAFEVVVADNGSTDGSADAARAFADRLPIRVVDAGRAPGINVARNEGVRGAHGKWIVLCDADDEVDGEWLLGMSKAFVEGHHLLAGVVDYERLNSPEVRAWRGASRARVGPHLGFLPFAHGANMGFTRELFESLGGFDEGFHNLGDDIEFCWRAQLAGFPIQQVDAVVHYRLRSDLRGLWRQSVNYARSEALLFTRFREHGLRRRRWTAPLLDLWWLISRMPFAARRSRRGAWLRRAAGALGRVSGAVRFRVLWW